MVIPKRVVGLLVALRCIARCWVTPRPCAQSCPAVNTLGRNYEVTEVRAVPAMSEREVWAFLREGTRTAHVATMRADGRPHVKPVWFIVTGTPGALTVVFTTNESSVTGHALLRDSRVALSVDDPAPPYSFVVLEGFAEIDHGLAAVRQAAARIGGRYMGESRAEEFGARNGVPGELLIHLSPTRITGQRAVTG